MTFIRSAGERESKPLARVPLAEPALLGRSLGKLVSLFLLGVLAAWANVCTPYNAPANGPFPAIVNGIDAVSWGSARVQWVSDASASVPATEQQILFATAAQWAQNPNVYPQTEGMPASYITDPKLPQGMPLSNLLPNTTYHVMGQSYQGSSWCTGTDVTFTTLPKPTGTILPVQPQRVPIPAIAMNGTHWVYGSNCGTAGANTNSNVQDCFNRAQPGDDIGFPPGTYQITSITIPNNPYSFPLSCSQSANTCTVSSGSAPANGTQIVLAYPPAPINPGIPYKVLNSSGATFQISYDGVTPITFSTYPTGEFPTITMYEVWPLTQPYIFVHSTANASLLPPAGVRLGPDSLAQYLPAMVNFQQLEPLYEGAFYFQNLAAGYYFVNVAFSTDPSVATKGSAVDPVGFRDVFQTQSTNSNLIFDRCAFIPAGPPSRSSFASLEGSNIAVINSYQSGFDWWEPYAETGNTTTVVTTTSTSWSLPAAKVSWVGPDGTSATKQTCSAPAASANIIAGTVSGYAYTWIDPSTCGWNMQVPTGLTVTGTNITISSAATPAIPTYTYTSPVGIVVNNYSVIPWGGGTYISAGTIAYMDQSNPGHSAQNQESGAGFYIGRGPGPFLFYNDFQQGTGVAGVGFFDDLTNSTVCYLVACSIQYNIANAIHQRSTVTTNPCYFRDSACWNGGRYYWRNMDEVKHGKYVLQDGNIFGPYYSEVGEGACVPHFVYGSGVTDTADYTDSSEWTFTNNTCIAGSGFLQGFYHFAYQNPYPEKDLYIHNNLWLINGYSAASSHPPPGVKSANDDSDGSCSAGYLNEWGALGENFVVDHNTVWGRAGCQPYLDFQTQTLSSGIVWTNNIQDLVGDIGGTNGSSGYPVYLNWQASYGAGTPDIPNCNNFVGAAMFACLSNYTWAGNVVIPTYANGYGTPLEWTPSQISTLQSTMPTSLWPSGTTLANRLSTVAWFNPSFTFASGSIGNFSLRSSSPYISGQKVSTDGLDVGANIDQLEAAQGKVSNVRTYGTTSTGTTIAWYAPDSFSCGVDYGTAPFWSGTGTWTRVAGSATSRVQSITLSGLTAHAKIYYRVNCATQQPTGSVQLP